MMEDGITEGPLVNLSVAPAQGIYKLIVVSRIVNRYWKYMAFETPFPDLYRETEK